jgi:hypothetical protein
VIVNIKNSLLRIYWLKITVGAHRNRKAGIQKKMTPAILRDMFVVRGLKLFEKIGLAKPSYDDARKKYGKLTRGTL